MIARSSDHSGDSSFSWKYVKLATESALDRLWANPVTLDGTLSEMGPAKTWAGQPELPVASHCRFGDTHLFLSHLDIGHKAGAVTVSDLDDIT